MYYSVGLPTSNQTFDEMSRSGVLLLTLGLDAWIKQYTRRN